MSRRDQIQQMLRESTDDLFLLYALAMEERSAGDDVQALIEFDRVLAVDTRYVAAYFQKGQILAGLGRSEEARSTLEQGIRVAQEVGDTHAAAEMSEFLTMLD